MKVFSVILVLLGIFLCIFEFAGLIKDLKKRKDIKRQQKNQSNCDCVDDKEKK